jgi:hypothetical protein
LIVFDTSTLVGAALKVDSVPERALLRASDIDVLAFSAAVDAEISEVLNRPKFVKACVSVLRRTTNIWNWRLRPALKRSTAAISICLSLIRGAAYAFSPRPATCR